ncbi:hypothetical protein CRG98_046430 [Punica granatum]|uniref:Uncharacterized protein n=1 Tax=Punica granatum TaxID=22663 RepID=A0A2I0HNA4_PUNGR|nr:hypothetical protein CRG98_046430 [Punica granatum]
MQPKRGKLSAPHFGPPTSHTRILDRSARHYSSSDNRRQIGGHGVMNNKRRARHTEKIPVKVPRSSRANGPRPGATSQQSLTGQKDRQNKCKDAQKTIGGRGGAKFHPERPNRAKPTPEAPSRLNARPHDAWRY